MNWSPLQSDIFAHVAAFPTSPNLMVQAVAGSGKTTTIVESLRHLNPDLSVIMLAFNKSIALELGTRVPRGVDTKTFHSLGFAAYRARMGRVQVEGRKLNNIMRGKLGALNISRDESWLYSAFACRLVSLARQVGTGLSFGPANTVDTMLSVASHHALEPRSEDAEIVRGAEIACALLDEANRITDVIDFDEMLYGALREKARFRQYDVVFVDESQDTNPLQIEIATRLVGPTGRIVFVGDRRQAIYGFRGADSSAMDRIEEDFACVTKPLSVTYRCATAIVELAQAVAPELQASPGAQEGEVIEMEAYRPATFNQTDAILCRNTAPLISFAYGAIKRGLGVQILGRDIGKGLITLIEKLAGKRGNIEKLMTRLESWRAREIEKAVEAEDEAAEARIVDQATCIEVAVDALPEADRSLAALKRSIEGLFTADSDGRILTLSTVHKSKGMEWDRVFILDAGLMPSKWARREWQRVQEDNLQYVAYTRARESLVFINSDSWAD